MHPRISPAPLVPSYSSPIQNNASPSFYMFICPQGQIELKILKNFNNYVDISAKQLYNM